MGLPTSRMELPAAHTRCDTLLRQVTAEARPVNPSTATRGEAQPEAVERAVAFHGTATELLISRTGRDAGFVCRDKWLKVIV